MDDLQYFHNFFMLESPDSGFCIAIFFFPEAAELVAESRKGCQRKVRGKDARKLSVPRFGRLTPREGPWYPLDTRMGGPPPPEENSAYL
jgi:hypothetical protein